MRPLLIPLLLSVSTSLLAQTHDFYRNDFTPSPCAPANSCASIAESQMAEAAFKFYGLTLDIHWVLAHRDEVLKALAPACRRHASCLAVPGNPYWFCDDVLSNEVRPVCDKLFPGDEQCKNYIEVWLLGIDLRWKDTWPAAQECAKKLPPVTHTKPLELWMVPSTIPSGYKGTIAFYALDPDTHVPVLADLKFENQVVLMPASPAGKPATGYPIDYKVKFVRVPNAEGHTDVMPPMITATAEGFPPMQFRLAAEVPTMIVSMSPPADKLHRGKNSVTIEAHDAKTGKPVEARVMFGEDVAGTTNQPITIDVPRGKRPEIWVTSLFDAYSDTVVAKAK